jgi:hypothetical protein
MPWTEISGGPTRVVTNDPDPTFRRRPVGFTARLEPEATSTPPEAPVPDGMPALGEFWD